MSRREHNARCLPDILSLLHVHHAYLDQIRSSIRYVRQCEGVPRPEPRDEGWVTCQRWYEVAYRTHHVAASLQRLAHAKGLGIPGHRAAAAVYYSHVEPWPEWAPRHRAEWARVGVEWMAEDIEGWLDPFVPMRPKDRRETIRVLRSEGLTYGQIAARVGCSRTTVSAALQGRQVLAGKVVDTNNKVVV